VTVRSEPGQRRREEYIRGFCYWQEKPNLVGDGTSEGKALPLNWQLSSDSKTAARIAGLAALLLFSHLFTAGAAMAQRPESSVLPQTHLPLEPAATLFSPGHRLTAGDLDAFLDGLIPLQLRRDDIAGSVVVVVKDGKVFFAKGYGYADMETRAAVSPQETLFRPGSVGKLFTWTAVMQLVELGKRDLDHDVNDYLDFSVPHTFGKPLTVRNLMTHTRVRRGRV